MLVYLQRVNKVIPSYTAVTFDLMNTRFLFGYAAYAVIMISLFSWIGSDFMYTTNCV
jgi:hypothetical protein